MQKLNEHQANWVRALMTGAGIIDHGNPLAYFTEYQVTPDEFHDVLRRVVPDIADRETVANHYIDAYNNYATEYQFWNLVEALEPWDGDN